MKKIITVLFFAGFLTAASFAQSGHRQQNNTQSTSKGYGSQQNSGNSRGQYSQNFSTSNGDYKDYQQKNPNYEYDYGYNKDNDHQDRGDMRRNQYDYSRNNQRGFEDHLYRSWGKDPRHHKMYRDNNRD